MKLTNIKRHLIGGLAFIFCTLSLWACNGGSSTTAAPTPPAKLTQDEFNAFLAASPAFQTQETEVAALQKQMKRMPFGQLPTTSARASIDAVTVSIAPDFGICTDAGLLLGSASGVNAALGHIATRITCTGYEYSYSTADGSIAPLPGMEWDGANCTGNAFATQTVPPGLALNGYVFSIPGQTSNFAIPAGQTLQSIQVLSQSDSSGVCIDNSGAPFSDDVYGIVPNVSKTTGVPNSAVPVNIKNGG